MKSPIREYQAIQAMAEHRPGRLRNAEREWRHQPLQQVNVPNPGEPTRQLTALRITGYILFLLGCCLLAWAWPTDAVQTFLDVMRSQP